MKTKIWSIFGLAAFVIASFAWADGEGGGEIQQPAIPRPDPAVAEFARGVKFTVNGYNGGAEVQTNFPVLVRLSTAITGFDYGDFYNAKVTPTDPNALKLVDIGFVDAEGNGLAYDIDTWNTNGESLVWVNLPRMTSGTEFAMWYRSSKTGKALNPDNVWTNYAGVWHFREDYGPETGPVFVYDSTTNELTGSTIYTAGQTGGQQPATLAATDCNGKLGRVRRMGNVNHNSNKGKGGIDVLLGETGSAKRKAVDDLVANFSGSFWIYGEVTYRYPYYVSRKATDADTGWGIQSRTSAQTTESSIGFWAKSDNSGNDNQKHLDITGLGIGLRTWTKIDFIYTDEGGGGKGYLYKNGVLVNSGNLVRGPAANTVKDLYIGGGSGTDVRPLLGLMDEVRLCYSVPTEKRIKADYDTVNEASFLTAGMVVTNVIIERPVVNFTVADVGASHIQFGGDLTSLGSDQATECTFYAKVWPTASAEPATWTELGTGFGTGSLSGLAKGLTPATAYSYRLKVTNDEDVDSYETAADFTTSGVGVSGTGGDVTRVGDDWIHYFRVGIDKGTGGITNSYLFTPPSYATNGVRALVVAGGGPGGYRAGGGGGAGGYIYNAAPEVSSSVNYTIHVGTGGTASPSEEIFGEKGGNSSVVGGNVSIVAVGGGAGGNGHRSVASWRVGQSGGSGGGSSATANAGTATSGQGNAGGKGAVGDNNSYFGGGGGGAGSSGDGAITTGTNVNAPNGGAGLECDITGVGLFYAGGGGAGSDELSGKAGSPGSGGSGVGGTGSRKSDGVAMPATQGVDGTGSGGGGGCGDDASYYKGGDGGDGIVIIRYPSQGDGSAVLDPIVSLQSSTYDAEHSEVSFTYRVAWAGYGHQVADVGIAWGYSPSALTTTNPVATAKIGIGSGTVQLPKVSKTVYLRMVATNAGGCSDDSVETAVFTLFNPDAPVGTISVTDTGVTNAVFSVDVTDFGTDASSASVTVEVCASDDFTGTILSFPAAAGLPSLGSTSVSAIGLENNTTYYARAIVVNSEDVELTTDAVEFSTLQPGIPVGTATTTDLDAGLTKFSASALVTSFGFGSDSATVRLEVSTVSDFSTLAGQSDEVAAVLNTSVPIIATDLTPDTTYYRRVRIRNWWGIDTYVALPVTSTRSVPFSAAGPSWTASGDTVDISLTVSAVYDGAACTAVLTYGGETVGSRTFDAAGTVTWSGLAAKADGSVAQIVVTTTVDGVDYSKTFSAPVTPGASATTVTSVTPYCDSGDNALWMRPGDVVMLPDLYGAASYQVLNERFATISGSTLAALEPGIVGIRCVDASSNTNIMGVVVLPDAIGSGSVYVFNEKNHGNNGDAYSWSNPSCWRKVGSDTNNSFPQNADDIAILPFYSSTYGFIRHRSDITIGGLYAGMIRPDASITCVLEHYKDDTTRTVTFRRTDGEPVRIQVCPNGENNAESRIRLGGYVINVVWASDAVIDCGSSETDYAKGPRGFFDVKEMSSPNINTNTLQGVTLTFRGYPGYSIGGNNASGCTAQLYGFWKGTGTLVKEGMGGIVFNNDIGGLSGGIVLKGQKNPGGINAPSAQFSIRGGGATNLAATVYGVVPIGGNGQPTTSNGAGLFGTSAQVQAAPPTTDATTTYNGASAARGPDAPAKGLTLVGGSWYAGRIDNKTWGVDAKDDKEIDFLALGPGMSYVQLQARSNNTDGYPINVVTAKQLRQTERGTLAVSDPSRYKAPTETPSAMFYAEDWADHATGAEGDCTTSSVHPVIPWIVASVTDGNWGNVAFATFDEDGRLVQEKRDAVQITQAPSEDANLYVTGKNLDYGAAGGDYTINSLYLSNGTNNRWLGANRTLRIKSGGLILHGKSAIGLPGRTDNGTLVLGDATHPAYVWAKGYNADTNYLGAAVTAAGGFVSAYPGNLCLVGDQTGIADEIAVNGGTLAIGTADADCSLAVGIPIRVCTGAKLLLPTVTNAVAASSIKLDGAGKNSAKVILPVNQTCASLAVRDVYESNEWTTLPEGTYGSSESAAEFVRDDLFVGPGVLTVGEAPTPNGVMFLIY